MPEYLAGTPGTCPHCEGPLTLPGEAGTEPSETGEPVEQFGDPGEPVPRAQLWTHDLVEEPMTFFRPANSPYRRAQRYKYVPGVWNLLAWMVALGCIARPNEHVLAALGLTQELVDREPYLLSSLAVGLYAINAMTHLPTSRQFLKYTGRVYFTETIEYARAGGYDISQWCPLVAVVLTFGLFRLVVPHLPKWSAPVWGTPYVLLFFLVSTAIAIWLCWAVAGHVFAARFGSPLRSIFQNTDCTADGSGERT